jgi:isocitrate dehydrogenase (NAD+)
MLRYLRELEAVERLQKSLEKVYLDGKALTGDVGGSASTRQFADAIIANL